MNTSDAAPAARVPSDRLLPLKIVAFGLVAALLTLATLWFAGIRPAQGGPRRGLSARWMLLDEEYREAVSGDLQEALAHPGPVIFLAAEGTPVRALAAGKVVFAEVVPGFGLWVTVESRDGQTVNYAHLEAVEKPVAGTLAAGDTLGTAGRIGNGLGHGVLVEVLARDEPIPLEKGFDRPDRVEDRLFGRP